MKKQTASSLSALFSAFARELQGMMLEIERADLAAQVPTLQVVARCTCGDHNCAHFYTEPPPEGAYGAGHASVVLPAKSGSVVLDVIEGRIVAVEVLDRPDVKSSLDQHLPLSASS